MIASMKTIILTLAVILGSQLAHAEDVDDIKSCLAKWGNSPFTAKSPYRVVAARVKVMGIGGDIDESTKTSTPELVLIRPAVTVMAKTLMTLGNPNGWYCLKGKTAVMGKMQIDLHCSAHVASSESGATVMGSDKEGTGTTVMGSTKITRIGKCAAAKEATETN